MPTKSPASRARASATALRVKGSLFQFSFSINKHLMTGPEVNSEFCFPETLNVPRGEAEGNIEVEGKQNSRLGEH